MLKLGEVIWRRTCYGGKLEMDYEGSGEEVIMAFVLENEIGNWNLYMEIMQK